MAAGQALSQSGLAGVNWSDFHRKVTRLSSSLSLFLEPWWPFNLVISVLVIFFCTEVGEL